MEMAGARRLMQRETRGPIARGEDMAADSDYDVFISYSRDPVDRNFAARLQDELQRFARPWFRPGARTVRVYRDQTNLPPSPDLWGTLERAMSSSRWLVLVASPRSAQSQGVRRELDWWLGQPDSANTCIALAEGELRWDDGRNDFDWAITTALARETLGNAFTHEPAWIDLRPVTRGESAGARAGLLRFARSLPDPRLQDAAASLIAEIKQVPKDALIGEHLRRTRQLRRAVTSTLIALVLLLAASVTAGLIAHSQRNQAVHEATVSEAGQLAAVAQSLTGSHLDLAELFAAEAYRLYPDSQTKAALFDAVTADPHLMRYLPATGTVSAVATSADGQTAVAGTVGGNLLRWNLPKSQRSVVASMPARISGVAVSGNGDTIAAVDGSAAMVWTRGQGVRRVPVPARWTTVAAAVSPSGQYVAFSADNLAVASADDPTGAHWLLLVNEATGHVLMARADNSDSVTNLTFDGETQLVALEIDGHWERLTLPSLTKISASSATFGLHDFANAISATGTYISFTNGGPPLDVYNTVTTPTPELSPPLGAWESGELPTALAISADGRVAANADSGTIYVSDITSYKDASSNTLLSLPGNTTINNNTLAFLGRSDSELLSASGSFVTMWNLAQYSRITSTAAAEIPSPCEACLGPGVYPSPDARHVIITAAGTTIMLTFPPAADSARYLPQDSSNLTYGPALWSPDGRDFSILNTANGGGQVWSAAGRLVRYWATPSGHLPLPDTGSDVPISLLPTAADGKRIAEIDTAGNIIIRSSRTGAVERQVAGPVNSDNGLDSRYQVAADSAAKYAAVIVSTSPDDAYSTAVDVVDIGTGAITRISGGDAAGVAYDGEQLLIQRSDGTFEVRNADGRRLIRSFAGDPNAAAGPVVSSTGLAVEVNPDGTSPVFDVTSGQQIGSITLPAGPRNVSTSIAFTPGGTDLISATEDVGDLGSDTGYVTESSFSPSLWSASACAAAGHTLTAAEWQQYIGAGGPAMPSQLACQA
jgi:WD40 repeat protein